MNNIITIWDIDNCLADDGWRIPFIRRDVDHPWDRYFDYHDLCIFDQPGRTQRMLFRALSFFSRPVFITARPEAWRYHTTDWIEYHLKLRAPVLLMRRNDDHRPSVQIKREHVRQLMAERHKIFAAFDDHAEIITMYRELGLRARHMAIDSDHGRYHKHTEQEA